MPTSSNEFEARLTLEPVTPAFIALWTISLGLVSSVAVYCSAVSAPICAILWLGIALGVNVTVREQYRKHVPGLTLHLHSDRSLTLDTGSTARRYPADDVQVELMPGVVWFGTDRTWHAISLGRLANADCVRLGWRCGLTVPVSVADIPSSHVASATGKYSRNR